MWRLSFGIIGQVAPRVITLEDVKRWKVKAHQPPCKTSQLLNEQSLWSQILRETPPKNLIKQSFGQLEAPKLQLGSRSNTHTALILFYLFAASSLPILIDNYSLKVTFSEGKGGRLIGGTLSEQDISIGGSIRYWRYVVSLSVSQGSLFIHKVVSYPFTYIYISLMIYDLAGSLPSIHSDKE